MRPGREKHSDTLRALGDGLRIKIHGGFDEPKVLGSASQFRVQICVMVSPGPETEAKKSIRKHLKITYRYTSNKSQIPCIKKKKRIKLDEHQSLRTKGTVDQNY
ncbi:hypothetical protein LIA77_11185 [Sarocladium implicatum]|nr:hypothetical protein LIA77_11185 [Sarocladium implicatum]